MEHKTVLVTGAGSGIGLACARLLLVEDEDFNVLAFDIDKEAMKRELPAGHARLRVFEGDVTDERACDAAVGLAQEEFGGPDALLHWAATKSVHRWDELSADELNHSLEVNVTGSFLIARAAARPMVKQGRGAIVLCSSAAALAGTTGGNGQAGPAYCTSKGAIVALARSLAQSLSPYGVRVNTISPGITETPLIAGYSAEQRERSLARFPLGRFGQPEEIAYAAIFLISDRASFMTGSVMHVNGGSNFA